MVGCEPGGLPLRPAMDATLMMRPYWRGIIERRPTSWLSRNRLRILRFMTLSHASTGWSSVGAPQVAPALLTRMSMWPKTSCAVDASRATFSSFRQSPAKMSARIPLLSRCAFAASSSSALRADKNTRAPISPSASAICRPRPREPPVINAVRPSRLKDCLRLIMIFLGLGCVRRFREALASTLFRSRCAAVRQ